MAKLKGGTRIYGDIKIDGGIYDSSNNVGTASSVLLSTGSGIRWESIATAALQGVQGAQGLQGLQGLQGTQGLQGLQGLQGRQGTQGLQGLQGVQGTQGTQGLQGLQGTQGLQGLQGRQGTQGLQGLQGLQGTSGVSLNKTVQTYTATSGQTTFSVSYTVGFIDVYLNGARLSDSEYTATNGTSVILSVGATAGDVIDLIGYTGGALGAQGTQGTSGPSTTINATNTTTNATYYPVFVGSAGADETARVRTTSTAFSFNASTGTLTIGGDLNSGSDERYKTNIQTIENALITVNQLRGVSFNWKESGKGSYGVIAQELEKILPDLVSGDQHKTVNYNGLIGVLIEAIKELQNEVEYLKENK